MSLTVFFFITAAALLVIVARGMTQASSSPAFAVRAIGGRSSGGRRTCSAGD